MHIWLISSRFPPRTDALSEQTAQLAWALNDQGRTVDVFTTLPRTPHGYLLAEYANAPFILHEEGEPNVFRHWTFGCHELGRFSPWFTDISLACMLLRHLWRSPAQKPDVIWYSFPPLITAFVAKLLAKRYKAQLVLDIDELWPDHMQADGRLKKPQGIQLVTKLYRGLLALSSRLIVGSAGMRNAVSQRTKPETKFHILPPLVSLETLQAARETHNRAAIEDLRVKLQIGPLQKVVMYIGQHSAEHDLIQFLKMARLMEKRTDITFLLVGEGIEKDRLKQIATALKNSKFAPMPDETDIWAYYGLADVCVITQAPWAAEYMLPPRIAQTFAAARPLVVAGGADLNAMAQAAGAEAVAAGDIQKMAYATLRLLDDAAAAEACATGVRTYAEQHARLDAHLPKLIAFLEGRDG